MAFGRFSLWSIIATTLLVQLVLLLITTTTVANSSKINIIDDEEIESIIEKVCKINKGSLTQISRTSTIYKLIAYFKSLSSVSLDK